MDARTRKILATAALAFAWSGAIAFGLCILLNYESTPGGVGRVPQTWPAKSRIAHALDRPTLVMLAHPLCSCTRASVDELARALARAQREVSVYVLFWTPNESPAWQETELRRRAAAIPGVTVVSDRGGTEARLFGAETSGQTLLFNARGRLIFSGGITSSRGHAGDNAGESALVSLINGQYAKVSRTFVFGCSLSGRQEKADQTLCPQ
ncbi:MAG TPA: hypothetical protein VGI60_05895 [Chthoniobacterales bacterium]